MPTLLIIDDSAVHRAQIVRAIEPAQIFDQVVEAEDGLKGLPAGEDRDKHGEGTLRRARGLKR